MTYEQKVKTFICVIFASMAILLGFMSYAIKTQQSGLKRMDRLFDQVEQELNWMKL